MRFAARRTGLTLIEVLVTIAIVGLLVGLSIPAVQRVRAVASRSQCADHLRQIGIALHAYHDSQQTLPPGVSFRDGLDPYPWMSWLARILPYADQDGLWRQAQGAYSVSKWFEDDPPHLDFATVMPLYSCPADYRTSQVFWIGSSFPVALTSYLGVEGRNQFRKDGVLFLDSRIRLTDITDGVSKTLMVGERPPSADGRLGWWYAGMGQDADGSADAVLGVRETCVSIYAPCPPGSSTFGPGQINNQTDVLHYWSLHPGGGANFLFADGTVHFLIYSAAPLMPALASRAGREAVSLPDN